MLLKVIDKKQIYFTPLYYIMCYNGGFIKVYHTLSPKTLHIWEHSMLCVSSQYCS